MLVLIVYTCNVVHRILEGTIKVLRKCCMTCLWCFSKLILHVWLNGFINVIKLWFLCSKSCVWLLLELCHKSNRIIISIQIHIIIIITIVITHKHINTNTVYIITVTALFWVLLCGLLVAREPYLSNEWG